MYSRFAWGEGRDVLPTCSGALSGPCSPRLPGHSAQPAVAAIVPEEEWGSPKQAGVARLVVISDTHMMHERLQVPPGDVLLHCGDFTNTGGRWEVERFAAWFAAQPHARKLVIAGNHEYSFDDGWNREQRGPTALLERDVLPLLLAPGQGAVTYLRDELVDVPVAGVGVLRVYGAPWIPWDDDDAPAFALARGSRKLREKWSRVPRGLDVLLTHTPPRGLGDGRGGHAGCDLLRAAVQRAAPALHAFGHVHEAGGTCGHAGGTLSVNAACIHPRRTKLSRHATVVDLRPARQPPAPVAQGVPAGGCLWCEHPDCLEALEPFPSEAALAAHWIAAHSPPRSP
eukprot:TRINITY_DN6050_c0_g1_i4.p1 TRINITY_DN6050_c0_g1~~TRINITY_DN6050_c0_g1_i4.p1  ORF type:complete len:341 (+),score=67.58 TRINITY_DN6050_c0_g1_i4:38-1060(+)